MIVFRWNLFRIRDSGFSDEVFSCLILRSTLALALFLCLMSCAERHFRRWNRRQRWGSTGSKSTELLANRYNCRCHCCFFPQLLLCPDLFD